MEELNGGGWGWCGGVGRGAGLSCDPRSHHSDVRGLVPATSEQAHCYVWDSEKEKQLLF